MITLSIKQPWAYLICAGIKDIENRGWKCPEKYIGQRVLIHASAKEVGYFNNILNFDQLRAVLVKHESFSMFRSKLQYGAIIGSVEIADCVINHESIWAERTETAYLGKLTIQCQQPIYNWVLKNPILFDKPILNVKGKLRFWESEYEEISAVVYGKIKTICINEFK